MQPGDILAVYERNLPAMTALGRLFSTPMGMVVVFALFFAVCGFVFYKACENASDMAKKGRPVYPFSVNVSRVTAIQPDFLEYYKRIKQKFGIRDHFITVEFTESFAYENYEYLSGVLRELHSAALSAPWTTSAPTSSVRRSRRRAWRTLRPSDRWRKWAAMSSRATISPSL